MKILAGDVGGTKTSLAIYDLAVDHRKPLTRATYPSSKYPSLEALVRDFLGDAHVNVEAAVFGVAGPVIYGRSAITNLPWILEEDRLKEALDFRSVTLLNDLAASANAIPYLESQDLYTLQEGNPVEGGTIAVISPGTGLGEAFLTWNGSRYLPFGSEGGHVDFAPTTALQFGLLRHLQERYGHVSYERVCSGIGLPNIYTYLRDMGYAPEPPWLTEALAGAEDITPIIATAALDPEKECDLCQAALRTFVTILGAEAGNIALKMLATGGVFLGGGIPPRIIPALEDGTFISSFSKKGRFTDLLTRIPVKVILNSRTTLIGAAHYLTEELLSG